MKTPNFGYNTINGLDEKTIRRLEEEFQRHGYRNKTEFLVALWKKALDDLDSERSLGLLRPSHGRPQESRV